MHFFSSNIRPTIPNVCYTVFNSITTEVNYHDLFRVKGFFKKGLFLYNYFKLIHLCFDKDYTEGIKMIAHHEQ